MSAHLEALLIVVYCFIVSLNQNFLFLFSKIQPLSSSKAQVIEVAVFIQLVIIIDIESCITCFSRAINRCPIMQNRHTNRIFYMDAYCTNSKINMIIEGIAVIFCCFPYCCWLKIISSIEIRPLAQLLQKSMLAVVSFFPSNGVLNLF